MGNIVALFLHILTEQFADHVEVSIKTDGSVVVFVGPRGHLALMELSRFFAAGDSLATAILTTARVRGNARFIFHDTDAVEIRLIDSFKEPIDETVLFCPELKMLKSKLVCPEC